MRYLRSEIPSLTKLGLPPIFQSLAERHDGIILLAGPTGSGKSTTLSAMVDHINTNFIKHIISIEDPVEYLHPLKKSIVEQREVKTDTESFAKAMKSSLRQNPDVLVLGEMRDLESIASAITIAETGHLVFSTIHARSAVQTINKIIDIFPGDQQSQIRQQISETLLAVISQRLIPQKNGSGQVMAMEIMILNNAIANMIREKQTHQIESIIQTNKGEGMRLLEDDMIRLIQEDVIEINEALSHANNPQSLRDKLISLGMME
jgi:twitching motility protein PilT